MEAIVKANSDELLLTPSNKDEARFLRLMLEIFLDGGEIVARGLTESLTYKITKPAIKLENI